VSVALTNFVFEAANFLLLAAGLGWVLFKPVRNALDAERAKRLADQEASDKLRAEAEVLAEKARTARRDVDRELDERREQVVSEAKKEAAAIVEDARAAQEAAKKSFENELETRRGTEVVALAESVGRVAAESVRQLMVTLAGPDLDLALVRAACTELAGIPAAARRSAQVESARALDDEARAALQAALGVPFAERVVASLGAGVRVITPAGQVDTSALAVARRAGQAVAALANDGAASDREPHDG